jgi:hypothetical protein
MGIAITSGVLASLHSQQSPLHGLNSGQPKWESHTPGTSTPTVDDPTLPSRFIACVQREESARRLREIFRAVPGGDAIEVTVGGNVSAVQQSDVVLLWYARFILILAVLAGYGQHQHFPPPHKNQKPKKIQLQTTGCISDP